MKHSTDPAFRSDRFAGTILSILGLLTLVVGLYFSFVRPAMLPEDIRFTGIDQSQLTSRMNEWLLIVFHTWGGFITGFGILMIGVAAYLTTARARYLRWGIALAVLCAFGRFLLSNLAIHSDSVGFVGLLFALAFFVAIRLNWPNGLNR
jgi:hypothetical protein